MNKQVYSPILFLLIFLFCLLVFLQTIGKHKNGTSIGITYTLRRIDLSDGTFRYCMWLSRDNTDPHLIEIQKMLDHNQSIIPIDDVSTSFLNVSSSFNDNQTFDSKYVITRQRGRGGYGQVYLGCDKSDESKKVVIKFIKKTKVKLHRYVESFEPKKNILYEVAVLKQLKHPNIVEVSIHFQTYAYTFIISTQKSEISNSRRL
jgi:glutamyl/glutaminyl-tRNA synthetase